MNQFRIPSLEDWGEIGQYDYDLQYAFKMFNGKNIDEAVAMFNRFFLERAFELRDMPAPVFNYYIFSFKKFIESDAIHESDRSCAGNLFLSLIQQRAELEPNRIRNIYQDLHDLLYVIAFNQALYGTDIDIYGDFRDIYTNIENLMR